jgi:hypothetical protein
MKNVGALRSLRPCRNSQSYIVQHTPAATFSSPFSRSPVPSVPSHLWLRPIGERRHPIPTLALRRIYPAVNIVAPNARLGVIARHLDPRPQLPLNRPYSIDRVSILKSTANQPRRFNSNTATPNMSSQAEHPALLIPGPIEFDDEVLHSMSHFRYHPQYDFRVNRLLTVMFL